MGFEAKIIVESTWTCDNCNLKADTDGYIAITSAPPVLSERHFDPPDNTWVYFNDEVYCSRECFIETLTQDEKIQFEAALVAIEATKMREKNE